MEGFGWDGKFPTLESVAFTPLSAAANMGRNEQELLQDIAQTPVYRTAFDRIFPGEGVSRATVERALATYQRTIVPASAPFDRWIARRRRRHSGSSQAWLRPVHRTREMQRMPCWLALHRRFLP